MITEIKSNQLNFRAKAIENKTNCSFSGATSNLALSQKQVSCDIDDVVDTIELLMKEGE